MKKVFKLFAALIFLVLICLPHSVQAQLSDAERLERCQNNKNRLAELEQQLNIINAQLSQAMEKKEMDYGREQLAYVKQLKTKLAQDNGYVLPSSKKTSWDPKRVAKISADYNFNMDDCLERNKSSLSMAQPCLIELEKLIAKKINKAASLNRPAIVAKKETVSQQIAAHRNNLIALNCDNKVDLASGDCKLEGSWTQDTPGIGSTVWEIKSDGTADERGIGYAKGKATLKGNVLHIDWQTSTGYSGYYEWTLDGNCNSVKGTLAFKTGRTDSMNSTVKKN